MALDAYIPANSVGRKVAGQGILQESETPTTKLGTVMDFNDGRSFVYCRNGSSAALGAGALIQNTPVVATEDDLAVESTTVKGDRQVTVTTGSAVTLNQFADGYLSVKDETGEGTIYKIKSHPAASSTSCIIQLYDPIRLTWAAAATVTACLTPNPYSAVVVNVASGTTQTGTPLGVPLIPVTVSYYFWAQTRGVANVLVEEGGSVVIGSSLMIGADAGSVTLWDVSGDTPSISWCVLGVSLMDGVDQEYTPMLLRL